MSLLNKLCEECTRINLNKKLQDSSSFVIQYNFWSLFYFVVANYISKAFVS